MIILFICNYYLKSVHSGTYVSVYKKHQIIKFWLFLQLYLINFFNTVIETYNCNAVEFSQSTETDQKYGMESTSTINAKKRKISSKFLEFNEFQHLKERSKKIHEDIKEELKNSQQEVSELKKLLTNLRIELENSKMDNQQMEDLGKFRFVPTNEKELILELEKVIDNQRIQLKICQGTSRELTIKTKQYESQITKFQDDLEKQSIASQHNVEYVRKSYESKIESLETERDKYESQGIDQEIQIVRDRKSKYEHLQQKYQKECVAHQQAGLRKARISLYLDKLQ
jgi:DNA repair exonuclease SbcCD ATPase subunit